MDHQEAIETLKPLLEKDFLGPKEKEAVFTALGVLGWTSLAKSRIKALRDKRNELKDEKGSKKNFKIPPRGRKA